MSSRLGPKPRLGYTNSRIERAAKLRADAPAMAALTKHPGAGTYVIGGEWIVAKKGSPLSEPLFTSAEALRRHEQVIHARHHDQLFHCGPGGRTGELLAPGRAKRHDGRRQQRWECRRYPERGQPGTPRGADG